MLRFSSFLFIAFVAMAAGSLLHHGRGTVAERRAHAKQVPDDIPIPGTPGDNQLPHFGFENQTPPPLVTDNSPEAYKNVADYKIAQPTALPAEFNGVYCKGGACQYRIKPDAPTFAPPLTPPPMPIGGSFLSAKELCRGVGCLDGMGVPVEPAFTKFTIDCTHLFNDVAGGMAGTDTARTVPQVQESFMNVCKKRVSPMEVGACSAYANTFVGATAVKVDNPTVGSAQEVCQDTYWYIKGFKQAEIDLKLSMVALPRGNSLLNTGVWRFGTGGNGPSSPRGLKWREFAWKHHKWPTPPTLSRQLGVDGGFAAAFLQTSVAEKKPKPLIPGQDSDEDTPRGLPKYKQNAPCADHETKLVPQSATKYQIAPGNFDGPIAVPPVEVDGELYTYCTKQFSEIMLGWAQTAYHTQQLTKDWCVWQASVSSWVGKEDELGHPDWTHRTCTNMQNLVSFSLKEHLGDHETGLSSQQVCKELFRTVSNIHRTDAIVADAWSMSGREPTSGIPSADDSEMKRLMREVQENANRIFNQLRGQKAAVEDWDATKKSAAASDTDNIQVPIPEPLPDLPDSDDADPTALLAVSVERVRQSRKLSTNVADRLQSWGSADVSTVTA